METILDSLGQLGNAVPAEAYADAVPIILHQLQVTGASTATLICVQRLARDASNVPAIVSDNKGWAESKEGGRKVWRNASPCCV